MVQDTLPSEQPIGSYRFALNACHKSSDRSQFGLVNAEAHEKVASFGGKIVGKSLIEERNQILFFVENGGSQLWLYDTKTKATTFVCSDQEFGCTWNFGNCEYIYGEFKKFNKCKELHVYWSSACVYHVVNIDEMLNPVRKAAVHELEDVCGHFDLFKCICGPHISAMPGKFNGSALEGGAYACAVQLSDADGNDTNIFDIGRFAFAQSEDNVGGQVGKSSIKFNISSLDKRYSKLLLYIIKTVKGVTTVEKMDAFTYGDKGFTYDYYGQKGELVDISILGSKDKAYLRGQDLIQKDGFAVFYSLKNEKNLNYQKYANQITVQYQEYEVSLEQAAKYHYPSLLRGEVYAFGIVWKYCDGTYTDVYHIPGGGAAASTLSDSDSQMNTLVASSGSYKPVKISDFNTDDQFKRLRNPSDPKDRRNESDKLEESVRGDIDAIDADRDKMVDAADCHDTFYGCGGTAGGAMEDDINDLSNTVEANAELLAEFGKDKPNPDVDTTTNLKDAALKLVDDAVTNREYITRKRPTLNYNGSGGGGAPGTPPDAPGDGTPDVVLTGETLTDVRAQAVSSRGDNWVDGTGNNLTEEPPREISSGAMEVYTSTALYPSDKDCDGQRFYPSGAVKHHRLPWGSTKPHFVSGANGVESQYMPDNHPFSKTFIRPMGIKLSNIHRPTDAELGKPLCPNSPYKIVYVKRTAENKSIFAKGFLTGMFNGSTYGIEYFFPRHGVNSFETVDRSIAMPPSGMSRKGSPYDGGAYNFHSPDTDADQSPLPVNKLKSELALLGSGWRHGLVVEGKKPEDQINGTRKDNWGARVANNLSQYTPGGASVDILGITFAKAHEPATQTSGISKPLNNSFRESSVFLEASGRVPGDTRDKSFVGDVLIHFCPTECNAPYVALVRELPDQYGGVEGLKYSDLGINATTQHVGGGEIKGICGDTFIGPYSKRRTSYVSNKRGDTFNPIKKPGSDCRPRSWCDSPDDKIFEYLGIDFYPTKLPKSGDEWDPKNYAGLHTIAGECGAMGKSKKPLEASQAGVSESDFYGPRTLKSLVHTIVESEVNPYLRETGEGPQKVTGKVHYGNLKDLYLDASAPVGHPWEDSWLPRFAQIEEQPSVAQLNKKAAIRSLLTLILPAGLLTQLSNLDGIIGPVATFFTYPMISALWVTATNTLFTDKRLNDMLRIGDCKRDEEGGDLDEKIQGFEDNYTAYNSDFRRINDVYPHVSFPLPFNTCDCDECIKENINQDIYYSNPQNTDSEIDAYRNVRINNYTAIPGHYGGLKKMYILQGQLWAHLTDGQAIVKLNPLQMTNDIVLQQRGNGQMLSEPQLLSDGIPEGYAGTSHPNAGVVTPLGYFFVDDKARKIFRQVSGAQNEEISAYGPNFEYFKNHLGFCDEKACYDEKSEDGNHYSLGWDPKDNVLYFTKYDGSPCSSFTMTYDPIGIGDGPRWISHHSFIPQDYVWDRSDLYAITGGDLYRLHKKDEYLKVLGQTVPFVVETSARAQNGSVFATNKLQVDTLAEQGNHKGLDLTFNKISIENSTQGTGTRDVDVVSDDRGKIKDQFSRITSQYDKIRLFRNNRRWESNEILDLVKADCKNEELRTKDCECAAIETINESVFSCDTQKSQDSKGRKLVDDHIIYRLIFDKDTTTRLYLKKLKTSGESVNKD